MKSLVFVLAAMASLSGLSETEAEQTARLKWFTDA